MLKEFYVIVGGPAGLGVMRTGYILAKTFMRHGYWVFGTNDYPSIIRGGHNSYLLRISRERIWSHRNLIDFVLALDKYSVLKYADKIRKNGRIIFDEKLDVDLKLEKKFLIKIPVSTILEKNRAEKIMTNSILMGSIMALTGADIDILLKVIKENFRKDIAEKNILVAKDGYNFTLNKYGKLYSIEKKSGSRKILVTGNEAIGLGAIASGMKFFSAYPMTPASPILHFLARHQYDGDIVVIQAENELAAINMIIGAAFAGVRAMTATSGGGFSLMTEALGLAAMTETPIVIVLAQRPGPSTGLPTYTSQGDLRFVLHASQGEFPRIVVAPGDINECFEKTVEIFNLTDKYQVPGIILIDKYLAESHMSVDMFKDEDIVIDRGEYISGEYFGESYSRHIFTETGISPRAIPSTKNAIVKTNSSEHDEYGYTSINPKIICKMIDKRFRKIRYMERENIVKYKIYGDGNILLIGWGSTKGPILEAQKILGEEGIDITFLQIIYLSPFPSKEIHDMLTKYDVKIDIENNFTGQLAGLIMEKTGVKIDKLLLKYDGRPFNPMEIVEYVKEVSG